MKVPLIHDGVSVFLWHLGYLLKLFVYVLLKELFFNFDFFIFISISLWAAYSQGQWSAANVVVVRVLYKSLFKLCFQLFSKMRKNTSLVRTHIDTHTHPLIHWMHLTLSKCRQLKAVRATVSLSVSSLFFFSHFPPSLILLPSPLLFVKLAAESSKHWKIPPTFLNSQYRLALVANNGRILCVSK